MDSDPKEQLDSSPGAERSGEIQEMEIRLTCKLIWMNYQNMSSLSKMIWEAQDFTDLDILEIRKEKLLFNRLQNNI